VGLVFNDMQGTYACACGFVSLREILLPLHPTFYLQEMNIKYLDILHPVVL
jgi:hypothetical protein